MKNSVNESLNKQLLKFEKKLNSISPSFCIAKWLQVTIDLEHGTTHSCHHNPRHEIPLKELIDNPSALHNTIQKKKQRSLMLKGIKDSDCNYCWNVENCKSTFTDRVLKSSEAWAAPYLNQINRQDWMQNVVPTYLEVMFSKACNLSCSYCSAEVSSLIESETKKFGKFFLTNSELHRNHIKKSHTAEGGKNPYVDAFWEWLPTISDKLRIFRITGGEPLIQKDFYNVLIYFSKNPNPKLILSVNTNFNVSQTRLFKLTQHSNQLIKANSVKSLELFISLDTFGEQAEFIRAGLDYKQVLSNIEEFMDNVPSSKVIIMATYSVLSAPRFTKLLEDVLKLKKKYHNTKDRIIIDITYLREPKYLSIQLLPQYLDKYLYHSLKFMEENSVKICKYGFNLHEINKIVALISLYEKSLLKTLDRLALINFAEFIDVYSFRTKKSFINTFPELKPLYELSKSMISHDE